MTDNQKRKEHAAANRLPTEKDVKDGSLQIVDQGKNRPGFDLGGANGDANAGSGLGLGSDAFENRDDRSLSRRTPAKPSS